MSKIQLYCDIFYLFLYFYLLHSYIYQFKFQIFKAFMAHQWVIHTPHFASKDTASHRLGFLLLPQHWRSAPIKVKSSTLSAAKPFEVILALRKTPTVAHKPCQALYQYPHGKSIPVSTPTPPNCCCLHSHAVTCLLNSARQRQKTAERQTVNNSFAYICGKMSMRKRCREKSHLFLGNAASR